MPDAVHTRHGSVLGLNTRPCRAPQRSSFVASELARGLAFARVVAGPITLRIITRYMTGHTCRPRPSSGRNLMLGTRSKGLLANLLRLSERLLACILTGLE